LRLLPNSLLIKRSGVNISVDELQPTWVGHKPGRFRVAPRNEASLLITGVTRKPGTGCQAFDRPCSCVQVHPLNPHFMERFSIRFRISMRDYVLVLLKMMYRRPFVLLTTVAGVLFLAKGAYIDREVSLIRGSVLFGMIFVLIPIIGTCVLVRRTGKSLFFKENLVCSFLETSVLIESTTSKSEFKWSHFKSITSAGKLFLVIAHNNQFILLDKEQMSIGQQEYIIQKIRFTD